MKVAMTDSSWFANAKGGTRYHAIVDSHPACTNEMFVSDESKTDIELVPKNLLCKRVACQSRFNINE